ncbi:hypothetical protein Btru_070354 [Bulinus truncatus]|nr:hypothetical protein Btru_070354 [Bulinus truncatus]
MGWKKYGQTRSPAKVWYVRLLDTVTEIVTTNKMEAIFDSDEYSPVITKNKAVRRVFSKARERYTSVRLYDVNQRDANGRTALMIAVERNDLSSCQFLLEHGADPNISRSTYGEFTALSLAIKKWHTNFIRVLVEYGAHFACLGGDVALGIAVACNFFDIIRMGERILFQKKSFHFDPAVIVAFNTRKDIVDTLLRHRLSLELSLLRTDSLDLVRKLISSGVNVNFADDEGQTALTKAVLGKKIETVKLLLQSKANVEAVDRKRNTSLHLAVKSGNVEVVKLLVEWKANLEAVNKDGETALLLATSTELMTYLVSCGCNVNTANNNGETPLTRVTGQRSLDDVKLLIEKGADLNKVDECGSGVLLNSIMMEKYDIVDFLLEKDINVNTMAANNNSPLMQAIEKGNEDLVKKLIAKGANVNIQYEVEGSLLIGTLLKCVSRRSVRYGRTDEFCQNLLNITVALIDAGANLDSVDSLNRTALMIAVEEEITELLKLLLQKKANPNVRNKENMTSLMVAVDKYDVETVKLLISSGANVDATDSNGNTALIRVIERIANYKSQVYQFYSYSEYNGKNDTSKDSQCLEIVKILVNSAANVNITTNNKNNALVMALGNVKAEDDIIQNVVQTLLTQKANPNVRNRDNLSALMLAINRLDYKMASMLIKAGANVNDTDDKGCSILIMTIKKLSKIEAESAFTVYEGMNSFSTDMFLTIKSSLDIISFLITSGANVNAVDSYNDSALNIALDSGKCSLVRILMGKGADGNIYGCKKKPPLLHLSEDYGMDLVVDMVKSGVDVHVTDEEGNSALMKILNRFRYYDQTEYGLSHADCLKAVKVLTEYGADVNITNKLDQCPLLLALSTHSKDIVWHLIQTGADVNRINRNGDPALFMFDEFMTHDVLKCLINAGIDVLAEDSQGRTALIRLLLGGRFKYQDLFRIIDIRLFWKFRRFHLENVKLLIDMGVDVNKESCLKETALILAVCFNDITIVKYLLKQGAAMNTLACYQPFNDYEFTFFSENSTNFDSHLTFTTFFPKENFLAGMNKWKTQYRTPYLEVHCETHSKQKLERYTPLQLSIILQRKQIFRALLNADADILKTDEQGNDALHYAAMCKNKQFLCFILNKYWKSELTESDEPGPSKPKRMKLNLDINRTDKNQETALFKAAAFGRTNNVKILIKSNCDVNIPTLDKQTALLIAVSKGFDKISEMLLHAGAKFNLRSNCGRSVLELTVKNNCYKSFVLLTQADANIHLKSNFGGNWLHYVPNMAIAKYLVENKIDINQRDQLGRSPLYMAIKRRKTDLVHFLLNKGANVNAVTSTSNTALMLATKLQNLELVTTLLAAGADINIQNRLGWTALFIAAREMSLRKANDNSLAVFEKLFLSKPNLDLQDNLGRTLMMLLVEIEDFFKIVSSKMFNFCGKHMKFKDKQGTSVLVRTMLRKNADPNIIELILIFGADPVLTKRNKHILMDWIQAHYSKNYDFIYDLLMRMGQIQSVRYLIANCCIGEEEFHSMRKAVHGSQYGSQLASPARLTSLSQQGAFLKLAFTNPWPLVKLAFIAVSTLLEKIHTINSSVLCRAGTVNITVSFLFTFGRTRKNIHIRDPEKSTLFVSPCLKTTSSFDYSDSDDSSDDNDSIVKRVYNRARERDPTISAFEINQRNHDGFTALMIAVKKQNIGACEFLLELGADPNITSRKKSCTALSLASENSSEFVKVLARYGAHFACNKGVVALETAVECQYYEEIKYGERILFRAKGFHFEPAIIVAYKNERDDIVEKLLCHEISLELSLIITGSFNLTKLLIVHGVEVNFSDEIGRTALHKAALDNREDTAELLLQHKANLEAVDHHGNTSLHLAAASDNVKVAELLVKWKSNLEAVNDRGDTPLLPAVSKEMVSYLVQCGCNVNATNTNGLTRLLKSVTTTCHSSALDEVKLLAEKGADLNKVDASGKSALFFSISLKKFDVVDFLLQKDVNVNILSNENESPLTLTIDQGNDVLLEQLIHKRADVNLYHGEDTCPLFTAIFKMCSSETERKSNLLLQTTYTKLLRIIRTLINAGANLDFVDTRKRTALLLALEKGKNSVVSLLLEKKANVNVRNADNFTPLMLAIQKDNLKTMQLLINSGANVNDTHTEGNTILMLLIKELAKCNPVKKQRHCERLHHNVNLRSPFILMEMIQILIKSGANVNGVNDNKDSALNMAFDTESEQLLHVLLTNGADANISGSTNIPPLLLVSERYRDDLVIQMVKSGVDVNVADLDGNTALINILNRSKVSEIDGSHLRHGECLNVIKCLTEHGADVNVTNSIGQFPILLAISSHSDDIFWNLIEKGADVNKVYGLIDTALILAICYNQINVVKYLIKHGAKVDTYAFFRRFSSQEIDFFSKYSTKGESSHKIVSLPEATYLPLSTNEWQLLFRLYRSYTQTNSQQLLVTYTPVQLSILLQREQIFLALLSAAVEISKADEHGNEALHYAAMCKNKRILRILLKKYWRQAPTKANTLGPPKTKKRKLNFDLNRKNDNGETALFKAAVYGRTNNVKTLIKAGCDVNIKTLNRQTALLAALRKGFDKIAVKLLKAGADFTETSTSGLYVIHIAVKNDCLKSFNWLEDVGFSVDLKDKLGRTLLHYATCKEMARYLVESRVDINSRDIYGITPLYMAVRKKNKEIVKFILSRGANVNITTHLSNSPLIMAAKLESLELVKILLKAGADASLRNKFGWSALHFAAKVAFQSANVDSAMKLFRKVLASSQNKKSQINLAHTFQLIISNDRFISDGPKRQTIIGKEKMIILKDKQERSNLTVSLAVQSPKSKLIDLLLTYEAIPALPNYQRIYVLKWLQEQGPDYIYLIYKKRRLLRLCVTNGLTFHINSSKTSHHNLSNSPASMRTSPSLKMLICKGEIDSVRYLIANGCFGIEDYYYMRNAVYRFQHIKFYGDHFHSIQKIDDLLINAFSSPWPLVKLAFIAVSTLLGDGPERSNIVQDLALPPVIEDLLMFQTPLARLPVSEWSDIPLCFDSKEYERRPQPRPLLHCWPMGKMYI